MNQRSFNEFMRDTVEEPAEVNLPPIDDVLISDCLCQVQDGLGDRIIETWYIGSRPSQAVGDRDVSARTRRYRLDKHRREYVGICTILGARPSRGIFFSLKGSSCTDPP